MRAKTQIWIGIALSLAVISLLGFEEIHWGYIEWKTILLPTQRGRSLRYEAITDFKNREILSSPKR